MGRLKLNSFSALFHWRGRTLAFLCLAVFIVIRATNPEPLESLRTALFDTLQVMKPHIRHPDVPVVIVDIDEESLAHYGQWPWPRNLVAELVDRIAAHNPPAIGFDILFSEPDRLSPHHILTDYPELHPRAKQAIANLERTDARLARSLSAAPTVLGVGALLYRPTVRSRLVTQVPVLQRGGDATPKLPYFPTALQSLPQLGKAATSHGILNVLPEADGIIRRVPLVVNIDGTITPTLTVEMLRTAIGAPNYTIHFDGDRITGISIDSIFIPTEPDGRIWVNYTTHKKERYVSASDILDGNPAALNQIQGKLVLLGSTALGLVDEKSIPVEARINGIEIHAMLLESLITSELLTRPLYADILELALILITGLVLITLVPFLKPVWATLPIITTIGLLAGIAWVAHEYFAFRIDTTFAGISNLAVFAVLLGATLTETERKRRMLQADLEIERNAAAKMEGELDAARSIQLGMLPSDFPAFPEHTEFDLHAMLEPAKAVGGDLYDFAMLDEHHLFFIVGDVSGKGIPASLFMAITKALYKSSAMRRKVRIEEIMTEANAEISQENPAMLFVTVLAGIMDIRTGSIEFCNAGHDAPVLLAPGEPPKLIETDGGPPLCVLDDFEFPQGSHQLNPGEAIVLYTDGVTEAMNPEDVLYSADRMTGFLAATEDGATCETIVTTLYSDVVKFADGAEPSDDVTILALRYQGPDGAA